MPPHRWTIREHKHLAKRLEEGAIYQQIADELGLKPGQVERHARRYGLTDPSRQGAWRRRDWSEIDRIIQDCIEEKLMSLLQAQKYLIAIGKSASYSALHGRLMKMPLEVRRQAKANAKRRSADVCRRINMRRKAA